MCGAFFLFLFLPGVARRSKRLLVSRIGLFCVRPLALVCAWLLLMPAVSHGQEPKAASQSAQNSDAAASPEDDEDAAYDDEEDDDGEEEAGDGSAPGMAKASAHDDRTMHVYVGAQLAPVFPLGNVAEGLPADSLSSAGLGFGAHLGLGLSRALVLELGGRYAMLGAQEDCADCKASSFDLGVGFSYHAAQGIALDPWVSVGVGARWMSFPNAAFSLPDLSGKFGETSMMGLDLARLALGGDFYPLPSLGLGLFMEADIGRSVSPPIAGLLPSAYVFFEMGARIVFDPISKSSRKDTRRR